jgi:hypothetical protein
MGAIKFIKVKAGSLLETIIALSIAAFLFTLLTTIFVEVTSGGLSVKKLKAHEILKNYLLELKNAGNINIQPTNQTEYQIKNHISESDSLPGVIKISISIYDGNSILIDQLDAVLPKEYLSQ